MRVSRVRKSERLNEPDPTPGIRLVILGGFLGANAGSFLSLVARGYVSEVLVNPLAIFGGFMGIGLLGAMVGSISGLSLRLLLERLKLAIGWHLPVVLAIIAAAMLGFAVTDSILSSLLY